MRLVLTFALATLLAAQAEGPAAQSRWQRVITPPAKLPQAEQCIVLDADLYAHATPGLRDVRILQGGREIPYASDVSADDRVGDSGEVLPDDRTLYEVSAVLPVAPSKDDASAEMLLSAHVPVERIRLEPAPTQPVSLYLRAADRMNFSHAEELDTTLSDKKPTANFTIGANLQDEADIRVHLSGTGLNTRNVVLEMRRREICYQPLSDEPIRMVLGNAAAEPVRYDFAAHFQPKAEPLLAVMGPLQQNPDFHPVVRQPFRLTRLQRVELAIAACVIALLLTLSPFLLPRR